MRSGTPRGIAGGSRLLALAMCLLMRPALLMAQASTIEHAVKATYLYKFAPFVEWPEGAFTYPSDPLVLCIVGMDEVSNLVDDAVRGQTVRGRAVTVVHVTAPRQDLRCHILYIAASRNASSGAILKSVRGTPVLTITDSAGEARNRGIINLVVQDNRVRFAIDVAAASENHLTISSKLLTLATSVAQ